MNTCPSELAFERHLLEPSPDIEMHLPGCERCTARLQQMRDEGTEFMRFVFPHQERFRAPPRKWMLWIPAAALPALVLLFIPTALNRTVQTKGSGLALSVYTEVNGEAQRVGDGQALPAGSALRFRVQPSHACHLWLVSVDERGVVSRLFPAAGDEAASIRAAEALPGGALLDGRPGPERLYAICSAERISFRELERTLKASVESSAEGVRRARDIPALRGSGQDSVLLEKLP